MIKDNQTLIKAISANLKVATSQVSSTLELLNSGNTVPFIARYRKEVTGNLDEEAIFYIEEQFRYLMNLEARKEAVLRLIAIQDKLTNEIETAVLSCNKLSEVEDIYKPYQQKRKTRASQAIAYGLQPLTDYILSLPKTGDLLKVAEAYLTDEVVSVDMAINGAKDIIAQMIGDDYQLKNRIISNILRYGSLITKKNPKTNDEKQTYKMYYDRKERVNSISNHRIMAIDRGEKEKILLVSFQFDKDQLFGEALRKLTKNKETFLQDIIAQAVDDGLKRLSFISSQNQVRTELSEIAHKGSIEVFSANLEHLLSTPPLVDKVIMGLDPAFRTGCKLAIIDKTGKVLKISVIYPHQPVNKVEQASDEILSLCREFKVELIAIGNGTASRESETFIADLINTHQLPIAFTMVSEAGASVYSASKIAQSEFPDLQVEQRSAVSIARRLLDPLAELIKIDPKAIGVGQYQHDLPIKELNQRLDFVVVKSVNRVGIDLNTASVSLLQYCSGLNNAIAKAIVQYRDENGRFTNRQQLLTVPKLGQKAYYQAAGFLKIKDGDNILDNTFIHPENYSVVTKMIKNEKLLIGQLNEVNASVLTDKYQLDNYTLQDILLDLAKPNRDYRQQFSGPMLRSNVVSIGDLKVGDLLQGVVRNVVDFGAFVDIGLKEDGLIHISKFSKDRISHPSEIVSVGDIIDVYVYNIDTDRHKVQLSLLSLDQFT